MPGRFSSHSLQLKAMNPRQYSHCWMLTVCRAVVNFPIVLTHTTSSFEVQLS